MWVLLKPLQWIYSVYAQITFVGVMLLIFPFVILASFFGRIRGGNMILRLCMLWADIWFPLIFVFPKRLYEVPHDKSKQYIFVCNHISYLDSAVLVKAFRQPVRPLGKIEMGKVPLFGFIYRKAIVAVDRSSADNRAAIDRRVAGRFRVPSKHKEALGAAAGHVDDAMREHS